MRVFTNGDGNAGVPTMRFHDLRHTYGSLLIKDGIPVKVVSERLARPRPPTETDSGEGRGKPRRKTA